MKLHYCSGCAKELPREAFEYYDDTYIDGVLRKSRRHKYCKECEEWFAEFPDSESITDNYIQHAY